MPQTILIFEERIQQFLRTKIKSIEEKIPNDTIIPSQPTKNQQLNIQTNNRIQPLLMTIITIFCF
jgi:hypothetical protein